MTVREMITELTSRADTVLTDATWLSWLNLAYNETQARLVNVQDTTILKKTTTTTVAGQGNYTLPTGFVKPVKLLVGTTEYGRIDYDSSADSSLSQKYYIDILNNEYVIISTPTTSGDTITLFYESEITDLSADTDEPYFPKSYHELLIDGAMHRYHEYEKEMGKAAYYAAKYQNKLVDLERFLARYSRNDVISMKTLYDSYETDF